jgi:hypothetical protein
VCWGFLYMCALYKYESLFLYPLPLLLIFPLIAFFFFVRSLDFDIISFRALFLSRVGTQEVLNKRASFLAPNSLRILYLCCNACPYSLVISQPLSYIPSSCLADVIRAVASLYSSSTKTILTRSWLTSHLRVSVPNQLSNCR